MGRHHFLRTAHPSGPALHAPLFGKRQLPSRGETLVIFLIDLGRVVLALLAQTGRVVLFIKDALIQGLTPTIYVRQILDQMYRIGYNSLLVVGLTAFFTGGALALQIYLGSSRLNAEQAVAFIVAIGITRELGPVLGGLMVAGRVGASIAA